MQLAIKLRQDKDHIASGGEPREGTHRGPKRRNPLGTQEKEPRGETQEKEPTGDPREGTHWGPKRRNPLGTQEKEPTGDPREGTHWGPKRRNPLGTQEKEPRGETQEKEPIRGNPPSRDRVGVEWVHDRQTQRTGLRLKQS
ncbi:unnamed protein product [Arctogadus glacialis]